VYRGKAWNREPRKEKKRKEKKRKDDPPSVDDILVIRTS